MNNNIYTNRAISKKLSLNYSIYIPESYDPSRKYALMMFLHGAGERGNDFKNLLYPTQYEFFNKIVNDAKLRDEFILFAPQCPENQQWVDFPWTSGTYDFSNTPVSEPAKLAAKILASIITKYSVDIQRLYVTGLSMGGFGTWDFITRYPGLFAAAVPICGGMDSRETNKYLHTPLWIVHGSVDDSVSCKGDRRAYAKLVLANADDVHYTEYYGCGHDSWTPAYADERIFKWFISRTNRFAEANVFKFLNIVNNM